MGYLIRLSSFVVCMTAATAYGLVPLPPDAGGGGGGAPVPASDAGSNLDRPAADAGQTTPETDAGAAADTGAYPDTGCPDGVCCLVLPDFDASAFDAGPIDTGRRRRRVVDTDAGDDVPDDTLFGCSASGVSSLLWLLPLVATRRRRRS